MDELAQRAPRPPRLRADRRARQTPFGSRTRVGPSKLYGYDAHGNIAFLTDATVPVRTRTRTTLGGIWSARRDDAEQRLYAGEEFDPDLGLINLRARQYDRATGRFWTLDPATGVSRYPITFNRFLYADADPTDKADPKGMDALGELATLSLGLKFISGASAVYLLGIRAYAASSRDSANGVYADQYIAALAGYWGDVAGVDSIVNPLPLTGPIGVGWVSYCMIALPLWDASADLNAPLPAACRIPGNPIPG